MLLGMNSLTVILDVRWPNYYCSYSLIKVLTNIYLLLFPDLHGDDKYENIVTQKYTQLAADNVDISRTPIQIGYVVHFLLILNPIE